VIAAELRVSERSVRRWRQAWQAAGPAGLASRGQAAQCRLDGQQLAALDVALEAGPLAAGWEDQRWTLARVRDLVAGKFRVQYTIAGIWYLLQRRGWTCQTGARRAIERDDGAVEVWKNRDLLIAADWQLPDGVVVLVWDNLNVHRVIQRAMTAPVLRDQ
jgi:transposase